MSNTLIKLTDYRGLPIIFDLTTSMVYSDEIYEIWVAHSNVKRLLHQCKSEQEATEYIEAVYLKASL